ncbi:MAG: hypothetical protein AB7O47_09580 [Flavobacteriales bacterium]
MVRILNDINSIKIKVTANQVIGLEEWKFLVKTCEKFFNHEKNLPIIVEMDNRVIVKPIVQRAFKLLYYKYKNTLVLISSKG